MSNDSTDYLKSISNDLIYYPVIIALPIGVVGNLFSFYVYTRPNLNKKTNTGFLYAWLCVLNLIFMLYFVLVMRATSSYFSYPVLGYWLTLPCGMMTYFLRIVFCFTPWMQVIISFDRFLMVVYPHKKHILSKKWVFHLIMLIILAVLAIANMGNLFQYTSSDGNVSTTCYTSYQVGLTSNIITILLRAYVPFSLMLVFNMIAYRHMKKSKTRSGMIKMSSSRSISGQTASAQLSVREYNFVVSTLFIDLTFLAFYTPIVVHVTLTTVNFFIKWDDLTAKILNLYYYIALLCAYLYSIALLFIFIVFNRYFRSEVYDLLRIRKILPNLNHSVIDSASVANKINANNC